jgi:hypothetical protein
VILMQKVSSMARLMLPIQVVEKLTFSSNGAPLHCPRSLRSRRSSASLILVTNRPLSSMGSLPRQKTAGLSLTNPCSNSW